MKRGNRCTSSHKMQEQPKQLEVNATEPLFEEDSLDSVNDAECTRMSGLAISNKSPNSLPSSSDDNDSEEDIDNENDLYTNNDEIDDDFDSINVTTLCLFCNDVFLNALDMLLHCNDCHDFNISSVLKALPDRDQVSYARLINFIRSQKFSPKAVMEYISKSNFVWNDEKFLKTVLDDDGALLLDVSEDLIDFEVRISGEVDSTDNTINKQKYSQLEDITFLNSVDCSDGSIYSLKSIQQCKDVMDFREQFQVLLSEVHTMKDAMQRVVLDDDFEKIVQPIDQSQIQNYSQKNIDDDCYDNIYIHKEMLQDEHRTITYIRALEAVFDHIQRHTMEQAAMSVLDVGCGTGILSLAATRAAINHKSINVSVYAVDRASILNEAKKSALLNGPPYDKIHFYGGDIEKMKLPLKQVDMIVSEWMGYGLFSECMLDSVIVARDRYLKPDGLLLPHHATLYACLISSAESYKDIVDYWNDVYGFKMNNIVRLSLRDLYVNEIEPDSIVSSSETVKVIDVNTVAKSYMPFESEIQFKINQTCIVHGITFFFTADFQNFDHVRTVRLSTAPTDRSTHWKQSTLYLEEAKMVTLGLMSNPALLSSIKLKNPQMQRAREQNHEVSQFVNNPDLMRQTMEMIRNPTTIQEITRNHDRALINLESLPNGYNVRQIIYRDFQEPMLNVAHE
ncbi:hypothetical protein GJ496_000046, partial [Pomphorhynchus laevis]